MRAAALVLALLLSGSAARAAETPIPRPPTRWVTDNVGFLSPAARAALDARLEAVEKATGHQVVVWIGDALGDSPLDEWVNKAFNDWRLGRKGLDDGVALFVFASDRKSAIEVGYGLEDKLPDIKASRILNDVLAPKLRQGDRDGAITAAVEAILAEVAPGVGPAPAPPPQRAPPDGIPLPVIIILVVVFLILLIVNPRLALLFLYSIASGGRGGGGGGGFGGGGGRSGGGGARGSW